MARASLATAALPVAAFAVAAACASSRAPAPVHRSRAPGYDAVIVDPARFPVRAELAPTATATAARALALLVGEPSGGRAPLPLARVHASILVASGLATTTLDLTFRNDRDRVLEGELVLPLPEGAAVSSFSLEVGDQLRPASVVERERARVAFEQVERRGVDPGLVEWQRGNSFRTRVYPIPARGTKRLAVAWDEPLAATDPAALRSRLALDFGCEVESLTVSVEVVGAGGSPWLELPNAHVEPSCGSWRATSRLTATRTLALDLTIPCDAGAPFVLREPSSVPGEDVFVASVPAPLASSTARPRRVTLLWDASLRALRRDTATERAYVEALLRELGTAEVRLAFFSDDLWGEPEAYSVEAGACPALEARLAAVVPDGALRLAPLDLERLAADSQLLVVVSDGLASFDEREPTPPSRTPVVAVASAPGDTRALGRIARGRVVHLDARNASESVAKTLARPWVLRAPSGEGVVDLAGTWPRPVTGGRIEIAGRVRTGALGELDLRFDQGLDVSSSLHVDVLPERTGASGQVERVWALARLGQLLDRAEPPEAEVVGLAKKHGLVTPFTSLLVLETLEDYVRYRVEPPAELRAAWAERVKASEAARGGESEARLASLRQARAARSEWWRREFPVVAASPAAVAAVGSEQAAVPDFPGPAIDVATRRREIAEGQVARLTQARTAPEADRRALVEERRAGLSYQSTVLDPEQVNAIAREQEALRNGVREHDGFVIENTGGLGGPDETTEVQNTYVPSNRVVIYPEKRYWLDVVARRTQGIATRNDPEPEAWPDPATEQRRRDALQRAAVDESEFEKSAAPKYREAVLRQLYKDAKDAQEHQRFEKAVNICQQILERDPQNARALALLHECEVPAAEEALRVAEERARRAAEAKARRERALAAQAAWRDATEQQQGLVALERAYLLAREVLGDDARFYLEAADTFFARKLDARGVRVLGNLAALEPGSAPLLRSLGFALSAHGRPDLARLAFATVAKLRPEEPQSWRDLALAEAATGELAAAASHLEKVVRGTWDDRFATVEVTALDELADLERQAHARGLAKLSTLPDDLLATEELDVRVILSWDANDCDVDLWVTEPTGEKVYYGNKASRLGGAFGRDYTRGYGPEEYRLRRAPAGTYKIQAYGFGDTRQTLARGLSTVRLTVIRHWGTDREERRETVARLGDRALVDLDQIVVGGAAEAAPAR